MNAAGNEEQFFVGVWFAEFCIFGDGKNGNSKARNTIG